MPTKYVLVTGVSSGIGLAIAEYLNQKKYFVFGSVRSKSDGDAILNRLSEGFHPLVFDVTDLKAIKRAKETVQKIIGHRNGLSGLINNAGISVPGPLMHLSMKDLRYQFEVNVFGTLNVTQSFLPLLGAHKTCSFQPGRIINISSVSGRIAFPLIGAYVTSKHALEAISDVLRRELNLYGIKVVVIQPGNTETPIWEKAKKAPTWEETDYKQAYEILKKRVVEQNKSDSMPPRRVAKVVYKALNTTRPKTRYAVVRHKYLGWYLPRLLSDRLLDRIITRSLKLIPKGPK